MMHTERNWILALLSIAVGTMLVFGFTMLGTDTVWPEGYAKLAAADSPTKDETAPDIAGVWSLTQDGETTNYVISKSDSKVDFNVSKVVISNIAEPFEYQLKWDSNLKAFRGMRVVQREGFSASITMLLTTTVQDKGKALKTKSMITAESLDQPELKEHTDELRKIYQIDVVWTRQPIPKIAGRWMSKGFADGCTIVAGRDELFYSVYFGSKVGPQDKPDYEIKWDPESKTFEGWVNRLKSITLGQTPILKFTVEDNENTLHVKFAYDKDARNRVVEALKQLGMTQQELEAILDQKWVRLNEEGATPESNPAEQIAQAETAAIGKQSTIPNIEGRWVMPSMIGARAIIQPSKEANFNYEVSYRPRRKKEDEEPKYRLRWDPKIQAFEGTVHDEGIPGKSIVRVSTADNGVTLRVRYVFDEVAKKAFAEAIKSTALRDETDQLLDMSWTRETNETSSLKSPAEVVYTLGLPIPRRAVPDIAGEWSVSHGNQTEHYKIVPAKSESGHFVVHPASPGLDVPIIRFQWDAKSSTFVGKVLAGVDEKLQIALRINMTATVEPEGDAMLVTTSIDPEVLARILKRHGRDSADEASKQCEQEAIWTRDRVYRVRPAADQDAAPAIGGVWLMGDRGRFGKCNIVPSATEGYAFDVYTLKSILSSNVSQAGPAYRLQWIPERVRFEASAQLSNDPKLSGKVNVGMTVEDDGKVLRVISVPDEGGMKSIESLKQKGINQEAIDQWLDMKWTRENENQQDWTLTDELLGALSQAKPQGSLVGHGQGQGGFGGGQVGTTGGFGGGAGGGGFGGRNNPNPGAGGKNAATGAGGGNGPAAGGGAFGRLMDADPPAAPGRGRHGDEEDYNPFGGGMGLSAKKSLAPVRIDSTDFLLVETNDGLSAYSKSLGKWSVLNVGRPKDGAARLSRSRAGQQFASVIIDDQLYGFSSQAGEWDRISIPPESLAGLNPVHGANLLSVVVGDKTYVLSSKTGKWTASDQATQAPSFSATISSTEIEKWRQKNLENVDSQSLIPRIAEHEANAAEIAKQIRKLKSENPDKSDDSQEIKTQGLLLEKVLTNAFDLKGKLEASRVHELQSRVGRLEEQLVRRQTQRTKIIERHLRELIEGDETEWKVEPEKGDNPEPLQTGGGFF